MGLISKQSVVAGGITLALLLGATACGSDSSDGDSASSGSEPAGTLTVCSDIPYAPMEMAGEGPRGLEYTGFDIDLMDAMAETMNDELEVLDVDFDGILGNLASGKCDVVASSLTITDERKEQADFTEPYFDADQSLLVTTASGTKTLASMTGKTIGVQSATTGETYANENKPEGATIKSFPDTDGLFGALAGKTIDGILQDLPVNAGRAAEDDQVVVVETYATDEQYGFAVKKGSALKAELDTALAEVKESGVYDELYDKYFPKAN